MSSHKYNLDLFIYLCFTGMKALFNHMFSSLMAVWGRGWLPEPEIHSASDNTACWEYSAATGPRRCSCPRASKMEAQIWKEGEGGGGGWEEKRRDEVTRFVSSCFRPKRSSRRFKKLPYLARKSHPATHVHRSSSPDSLLATSCSITDEEEDLWRASMVEVFRGEGARRR